jgi:YggT family protein
MTDEERKLTDYKEVRTTQQEPGNELRIVAYKLTQFIWLLIIILEALIAIRIGLKLLGANPNSLFALMLYGLTDVFLFPFSGLINNPTFGSMVVEISSFFAMLMYALLGWVLDRVIYLIFYWPRSSTFKRQTVVAERDQRDRQAGVTRQ